MDWTKLLHRKSVTASDKTSVLIVEDETSVRDLWRSVVIALGYDVAAVENARLAIPLVKKRPHVALVDVHLPGPSGLWLADEIRTISPATAIVFATGDRGLPPNESLRPGVVAYLVKPIRLEPLQDAIEAGVRWSQTQRVD
jgi:CheY-like chemotaxis protein